MRAGHHEESVAMNMSIAEQVYVEVAVAVVTFSLQLMNLKKKFIIPSVLCDQIIES